jgi:SMC interacting uncharacterized protein involved in chromosome segregation
MPNLVDVLHAASEGSEPYFVRACVQVLVAQYERLKAENDELVQEHDVLVSAYQKLQQENEELNQEHEVLAAAYNNLKDSQQVSPDHEERLRLELQVKEQQVSEATRAICTLSRDRNVLMVAENASK